MQVLDIDLAWLSHKPFRQEARRRYKKPFANFLLAMRGNTSGIHTLRQHINELTSTDVFTASDETKSCCVVI